MDALLRQAWLRYLVGGTTMIVGFTATAGMLVFLQKVLTRQESTLEEAVSFDAPPPPRKPPPTQQAKPKPKPRPQRSNAPPPPSLGSALAGMSFGLPQFQGDLLGGGTQSLVEEGANVVMDEDVVDDPPRPLTRSACEYPTRARSRNISGFVTLSLLVNADGSQSDLRILESEPPGVFDEIALACIRGWRFEPAMYEGRPVTVRARQTLRWELE